MFFLCLTGCFSLLACGQKEETGTLPEEASGEPVPTKEADAEPAADADITPTKEADITPAQNAEGAGGTEETPRLVWDGVFEAPSGEVVYENVEFADILEIHSEDGKGIRVDLDGDGKEDNIYVCRGALYINDVKYTGIIEQQAYVYDEFESSRTWWLMDIVKEDGRIEMLFPEITTVGYRMYHYDTDTLMLIGEMYESASQGDAIRRHLSFADDKTISCLVNARVLENVRMNAYCSLDENGMFAIVPGDYAVDNVVLTATQEIRLYADKDADGAFAAAAPQKMTLTKTDGVHWNYLVAEDGTEGWVYTEYIDYVKFVNGVEAEECFEGFSTAG